MFEYIFKNKCKDITTISLSITFVGVPVNYTNWAPGRKDNFYSHNVEDCALFVKFLQGQWDDIPCGSTSPVFEKFEEMHYFICQFRKCLYSIGSYWKSEIKI